MGGGAGAGRAEHLRSTAGGPSGLWPGQWVRDLTQLLHRLQEPCLDLLQAALCSPTCPEHLQLLCAAILREMAPMDSLGQSLCGDHVCSGRRLSLEASVLLAQVRGRPHPTWQLGPWIPFLAASDTSRAGTPTSPAHA